MTSDSQSLSKQHDLALPAPRGSLPPFDLPTPSSGSRHRDASTNRTIVSMAVLPKEKAFGERTRLLAASETPSAHRASPTSSASTSPSLSERDRVHPWTYHTATAMVIPSRESAPSHNSQRRLPGDQPPLVALGQKPLTTFSKLLAKAQSLSSSLPLSGSATTNFSIVGATGTGQKQQRRRHSILRVSSNKALTDKPLRKSASVEFALHHEALQKLTLSDRRETTSNTTPRRLTHEEKAELYKVRPDLEVGPSPFFKEQMREMEQRNQRRMLFAIFGGMICIMFLLVVYYIISIA